MWLHCINAPPPYGIQVVIRGISSLHPLSSKFSRHHDEEGDYWAILNHGMKHRESGIKHYEWQATEEICDLSGIDSYEDD